MYVVVGIQYIIYRTCQFTVYIIARASGQQKALSSVSGESEVIPGFLAAWGSVP